MVKAGVAGAALGALALATVVFVAPIAAQGPGGPGPADHSVRPAARADPAALLATSPAPAADGAATSPGRA